MKNYSLYVNYKNEPLLVCEDETSANAESFKDALLTMHRDMMQYAYHEDAFDLDEMREFLMYADLLIAIYRDEIQYDPETDADRADPDDACFMIDATQYIDAHYSI